jgi:hypothetical protein
MAIIYFGGGVEDEQARGPILDNGVVQAYAVRRDDPTNMIFLGGHRIDDAPNYNISEGKISPEYRRENGRNKVVENQLSADIIKSITFNLKLPNRLLSVTDRIYQLARNCTFDLFFVPLGCETDCDEWFWYGEDAKFGARQVENAIIGYDDNEAPINTMRTVRVSNQLQTYLGLQVTQFADATEPMYAVAIIEDDLGCDDCGCPYQTIVRGGAGPALGDSVLEYSEDGGATWTTIVTTAIGTDLIITDIEWIGGYLVVSYSDVAQGLGTDGGIGYAFGLGTALTDVGMVTLGLQAIVNLNGRLYAFGSAGETWYSCDNGQTWTQQTDITTETFLDAIVDRDTGNIFLSASNAEAWVYDGVTATDLTAEVAATGATDLESVGLWRSGAPVFGGADGFIYENWNWSGVGTGAWVSNDFGASTIGALAGDGRGYRNIVAHGTDINRREIKTNMDWEVFNTTPAGNYTAIAVGKPLQDEGVNYYIGVTDTGETVQIAACSICFEGCF